MSFEVLRGYEDTVDINFRDLNAKVYGALGSLGPDQVPVWRDLSKTNNLCAHCTSIGWDPILVHLSVADGYSFLPRRQLYAVAPCLRDVRISAHAGCHLCTLILTGLITSRYRFSVKVDPLPQGLHDVTDEIPIQVHFEAMMKDPAVWLLVTLYDTKHLSGWYDVWLPIVAHTATEEHGLSSAQPAEDIVRAWFTECSQNHALCRTRPPRLPKRVINVSAGELRLEEPRGRHDNYATLSYCIGQAHLLTATSENLEMHKAGINLHELPQTAQDAIWWTRKLNIPYLWLDSLCILQDSLDDRETELGTMAEIYENATVTIAAVRANTANEGCKPNLNKLNMSPCSPIPGVVILPDFDRKYWLYEKSILDSRAWCFQEVHLSRRVLRVGGEEVAWQCRTCKRLESDPAKQRSHDFRASTAFFGSRVLDAKIADTTNPFASWYSITRQYGRRSLTSAADRLPAYSGMAKHFQKVLRATYVAGIWKEDLLRGMLWRMLQPGRHQVYQAPTWSWASVEDGLLGWTVTMWDAVGFTAEVLDVYVETSILNPYGQVKAAKLTVYGLVAPVPSFFHDDDSPVGPLDWRRNLLDWDRVGFPQVGSVLFRLHERACLVLEPIHGRRGCWTRAGLLVTPTEAEPVERSRLAIDLLDSYDWRAEVVSIL